MRGQEIERKRKKRKGGVESKKGQERQRWIKLPGKKGIKKTVGRAERVKDYQENRGRRAEKISRRRRNHEKGRGKEEK